MRINVSVRENPSTGRQAPAIHPERCRRTLLACDRGCVSANGGLAPLVVQNEPPGCVNCCMVQPKQGDNYGHIILGYVSLVTCESPVFAIQKHGAWPW